MEENFKNENTDWKRLFQIGGVSALISAAIIPISIAAFFVWPLFPDEIFTVIQSDRLAGLMGLDFLYFVGSFLTIPLYLCLYVTLRNTSETFSVLALVLGFLGLVSLIPARPIFEMLSLSDQYAIATSESQKAEIMAAGRATLAMFHGTAFNVHYVFGTTSLLISSVLMLYSQIFNKAIAYVGIITNALVFTYYVPEIGVYLSLFSVVGYLIWWLLIAKKFLKIG